MVVSGLLVNVTPDSLENVKSELQKVEGIQINSVLDDHRIVVVVSSKNVGDEEEVSKKIKKIEGVVGINLAYHHFDDDERS
jgi:nitrate reductase NapD